MPKLKFDTTGVDVEEAKAFGAGSGESPRPGVYKAKVLEINHGLSKDDSGEGDPKRPRTEIIYQIQGGKYANSQLWEYLPDPDSSAFNDSAKKRMAQFLRAVGVTDKPGSGEVDEGKLIGKLVRVRVRAGTMEDGTTYRGEFGAVFKDSDSDVALTGDATGSAAPGPFDGDDELIDDDTIIEDDAISEETDWDARLAELNAMQAKDLQDIAREWKSAGWDIKIGGKKSDVADAVLAVEKAAAEQEPADDDVITDDDDIIVDDDDVIIEDDDDKNTYLTEDQLKAMDAKDLVKLAKDDFDIEAKSLGAKVTKTMLVTAILEAQAAPSGDDDELPPF